MNDDAFARLIAEDVKNTISKSQRDYLMLPSNNNKWRRGLAALLANLDNQLSSIDADEQADVERYKALGADGNILLSQCIEHYSGKKAKIRRFRFHVERRLSEVVQMSEDSNSQGNDYAEFLKRAILEHKRMSEMCDLESTAIDKALWAAVDNEWLFDSIDTKDGLYAS